MRAALKLLALVLLSIAGGALLAIGGMWLMELLP